MGGGLPIHVAGAFGGFVGPDAIEIVAAAALHGCDLSADRIEQRLKTRLRIQTRIDDDFVAW